MSIIKENIIINQDYINVVTIITERDCKPIDINLFEELVNSILPLRENNLDSIYFDCKIVDEYFKHERRII